jgi:hypothetical protein
VNGKFSCSLTRQEAHKRDQRWFMPKQRAELLGVLEERSMCGGRRASGGTRAVSIGYCSSVTPESSGERRCSDRCSCLPLHMHTVATSKIRRVLRRRLNPPPKADTPVGNSRGSFRAKADIPI